MQTQEMKRGLVIFLCFLAVTVHANIPKSLKSIVDCYLSEVNECSNMDMKTEKAKNILKNTQKMRSNYLFRNKLLFIVERFSTKMTADGKEMCPIDIYTNGPAKMDGIKECLNYAVHEEQKDSSTWKIQSNVSDAIFEELTYMNNKCKKKLEEKTDTDKEGLTGWSLSMKEIVTSLKYCSTTMEDSWDCFDFINYPSFGKDTSEPGMELRGNPKEDAFYDYVIEACIPSSWENKLTREGLKSCPKTQPSTSFGDCLSNAKTKTNYDAKRLNEFIRDVWNYRQRICNDIPDASKNLWSTSFIDVVEDSDKCIKDFMSGKKEHCKAADLGFVSSTAKKLFNDKVFKVIQDENETDTGCRDAIKEFSEGPKLKFLISERKVTAKSTSYGLLNCITSEDKCFQPYLSFFVKNLVDDTKKKKKKNCDVLYQWKGALEEELKNREIICNVKRQETRQMITDG